ncbi:Uncharacterised protein [Candidatus Gugararchaeum adminiculabundum]|nr:Uncharacterised protein [Candidatus Gugararchaeum adminiculabundum]
MARIATKADELTAHGPSGLTVLIGDIVFSRQEFDILSNGKLGDIIEQIKEVYSQPKIEVLDQLPKPNAVKIPPLDRVRAILSKELGSENEARRDFARSLTLEIVYHYPKDYLTLVLIDLKQLADNENPLFRDSNVALITLMLTSRNYAEHYEPHVTVPALVSIVDMSFRKIQDMLENNPKYYEGFQKKCPRTGIPDLYQGHLDLLHIIAERNIKAAGQILEKAQERFSKNVIYLEIASQVISRQPELASEKLLEEVLKFEAPADPGQSKVGEYQKNKQLQQDYYLNKGRYTNPTELANKIRNILAGIQQDHTEKLSPLPDLSGASLKGKPTTTTGRDKGAWRDS